MVYVASTMSIFNMALYTVPKLIMTQAVLSYLNSSSD